MIELKEKRQLNSKTFDNKDGSKKLQAHAGHIHYFDKLESKRFRGIDWNLIFDEKKRGWSFNYHSFRPLLPEYSDSFAEFRDLFDGKDQTIKYRAVGAKVKGVLIDTDDTNPTFDDNTENKAVLYKDCFGSGKDYLLYHTRSSLVKVATVNNPNDQKEDVKFRWEIELPKDELTKELPVYRTENKEILVKELLGEKVLEVKTSYQLDITKEKVFNTPKQTLIGSDKKDGKEWFTYLKGYKAWDSDGNTITVEAIIFTENGKRYLEKTIPLEFLQNAVGRVFTDTTTSYYSGSGDGFILAYLTGATQANWDSIHDSSNPSPNITSYNDTSSTTGGRFWFGTGTNGVQLSRNFFPIDTSSIPDTDTITSATMYIAVSFNAIESANNNDSLCLVGAINASNTAVYSTDYDLCGDINSPTEFGSRVDWITLDTLSYKEWALNQDGLDWISKTGYTKIGMRYAADVDDTLPTVGDKQTTTIAYSEYTGTSLDPYLEVTYTEASAPSFLPQIIMS